MSKKVLWIINCDSNKFRSFDLNSSTKLLEIIRKVSQGNLLLDNWNPQNVSLFVDEKGRENKKKCANFMSMVIPTINEAAIDQLDDLISNSVEYLPLHTPIDDYWIMNVSMIDCLNLDNSIIKYLSNGKVFSVTVFDFYFEKIEDKNIFVIPELDSKAIFVSDKFKNIYEANNLTGLTIRPVKYAGK